MHLTCFGLSADLPLCVLPVSLCVLPLSAVPCEAVLLPAVPRSATNLANSASIRASSVFALSTSVLAATYQLQIWLQEASGGLSKPSRLASMSSEPRPVDGGTAGWPRHCVHLWLGARARRACGTHKPSFVRAPLCRARPRPPRLPRFPRLHAAVRHRPSWHGGIAAAMLQFGGRGCWRIVQSSGFVDLSLVDQRGLLGRELLGSPALCQRSWIVLVGKSDWFDSELMEVSSRASLSLA